MRIQDIIRSVLDILDQVEEPTEQPDDTPQGYCDDDIRRFRQIAGIVDKEGQVSPLSNAPNEQVAGIESVTTDAGGGWMERKNPADMRADSISMYPNFQAEKK